ncbi:lamin tail domain-containing protein [Derxia lacustris]|uniref:lamin tail domain-containing protein n=1 Tax=Derxia lacustris TaxID=764842 RepID=UPI000A1703E0|nr:lamin tail domain-containing protein [Derxia lacustris]
MPTPPVLRPLIVALALAGLAGNALAAGSVAISQIYGGGGNSGATLKNDFIELRNIGSVAVSLNGWSVQYASSSGTNWAVTPLGNLTLQPGQFFLVQEAQGANGTTALPTPDASGSIPMSATTGKVALVGSTTALTCGSNCAGNTAAGVIDFVGFGSANNGEAGTTGTLNNSSAALRAGNGCTDSDSNANDFTVGTPNPRNRSTPYEACAAGGGGGGSGGSGGSGGTGGGSAGSTRIHDIQGRAHRSPLEGTTVTGVPGIVTAVLSAGFYLQDPTPDTDPATSEGIYVYTGSAPTVQVGDSVLVGGKVTEYRPGADADNLTVTELTAPTVSIVSRGNALPAATVVGTAGRLPPGKTIYAGASGDVETLGNLKPASNGLDFYESLEGMRLQLNNPVASGPTNSYSELSLLPDFGNAASTRTTRGGIVIAADDYNPERVIVDDGAVKVPAANTGASFTRVVGVLDYNFGNYKLLATELAGFAAGTLAPETTRAATADELTVASFNVENLAATNPVGKFDRLAAQIVGNLRAPDVIGLMEIQDNNGATDNGVVDASSTVAALTAAIARAGGPAYAFRAINPVNDQDGGEPGGNIRQGFLFNPARVGFVDRSGATPTTANAVVVSGGKPALRYSPGRVDPTNAAFASSRKPLAAEFTFNGHTLFIVANHFNSKGGDQPLFGRNQPPALASETQRNQQASVVAGFVSQLLAADASAKVLVLGDLNDFEFSNPVGKLKAAGMVDLVETLPAVERYTYVYDGNSQVLDHIMVSSALASRADYDVVHVNSEFADQASDHEPEVVRLNLPVVWKSLAGQAGYTLSGLSYNRLTQLYQGTVKLTANADLAAPLALALSGLPAGVTLANAGLTANGLPAIELPGSLARGATLTLTLQFRNPANVRIGYTPVLLGR